MKLPETDLDHVLGHAPLLRELRGGSVFLTGGTGFVGTWLVESFVHANRVLDLKARITVLTRDADGYRLRAPHLASDPAVTVHTGNVRTFEYPEGEFPFAIHAATEPYRPPDRQSPLSVFEADMEGTRRVLELARQRGTRRFLFTSSGAVYGRQPAEMERMAEEYAGAPAATDTDSAYGQSKRVSEWCSAMYGRVYGFTATVARLFAFSGPLLPLDANYAIGNFVRDALNRGPIRIAGDGTPWRSYLYAADLASWLWTILLGGASGRAYNVGSPEAVTIAELAHAVAAHVAPGTAVEIARDPVPGARPARYVPDVERAARELGLCPAIGLEEGIRRMAVWHRGAMPGGAKTA